MANQVYLTVFKDGNPLSSHPITIAGSDPASVIEEFQHQVLYLGHNLYFDKSPIRVHKPILFKMQVEKITPQIMQYLTNGDTVEKVKITWFQYNERTKKEEEYFSHVFEKVRFELLRMILPDTKAPEFERYNHLAEVAFRYKKVTWTYLDGNLIYSDEWNDGSENVMDAFMQEEEEPESDAAGETDVSEEVTSDAEVRLIEGTWIKGDDGFEFNKPSKIHIKAEFIKPPTSKKVSVETFVIYNENEQNLCQPVDIILNDNGEGEATVKLYYHDKYYDDMVDNPDAVCQYKFVGRHPKADRELVSELLEMPYVETINVDFVEIADVHFHHNCALPCLDEANGLIDSLVSAFQFSSENPDRKLIVEGHADCSGPADYNFNISKRRAEAIKALLDNSDSLWKEVVSANGTHYKIETEDYQQTLKALAVKHGWPCDPGSVDNKKGPKTAAAIKGFQTRFNEKFTDKEKLAVDGDFGPKSWVALFYVLRNLLQKGLKAAGFETPLPLTYGYPDGNGVYPCGESSPVTSLERSEDDRRVELVFYKGEDSTPAISPAPGRKFPQEKDPVTEKKWKKTPVKIKPPVPVVTEITLISIDSHFAPKVENLDIKYSLKGCADSVVKLHIESDHYTNKLIFERELTDGEKADGVEKVITWDGKTSCIEGDLKDGYINPLYSPYKVKLSIAGGKETEEKTFDVLYGEIKLEKSSWIGDESEPAEADADDWYRFQLNRLGYFGGPFTNNNAATVLQKKYLEKAVKLYKFNNVAFMKAAIESRPGAKSYKDLIDDRLSQFGISLKDEIKKDSNSRINKYFQQTGDVFNGGSAKLSIPSLYYEKSPQFYAGHESRFDVDELRLNEPFIPIKATILIKKKDNTLVEANHSLGKVKIGWRVIDPPEVDFATRYSVAANADDTARKPYIEKLIQWLKENETYSDGTSFTKNCPEKCGGKRELDKIFLSLKPFSISKPDKIPCTEICVDSTKDKIFGKTGVNFVPSRIAGDSYKIVADIDFSGLPNKDHLIKIHSADAATGRDACKKETGIFTVWRDSQIAHFVKWTYKETEAGDTYNFDSRVTGAILNRVRLNYAQSYIEFDTVAPNTAIDITDVITDKEYQEILKSFIPKQLKHELNVEAKLTGSQADAVINDATPGKTWIFFNKFKLVKEHMYGRDVPPQNRIPAEAYKRALQTLFYEGDNGFVWKIQNSAAKKISEKLRKKYPTGHIITFVKPHKPVNILTAPPGDNTIESNNYVAQFLSCGLADGMVMYDLGDSDKVDYVMTHEMGHHNFLYHHRTNGGNEDCDNPLHHDLDDNNCIMSYTSGPATNPPRNKGSNYDPFFCIKCNLRLRGWKVEKLGKFENKAVANGKVKPEKLVCLQNVPVNIEAFPDANYKFKSWGTASGTANFADATQAKTTVTVTAAPAIIEAEFEHE